MRLEMIATLRLSYGDEGFVLVRPYGSEEGSGWGEGDGTIAGDRVNGTVRWMNSPHRRSDVVMLPHAHGRIRTDDGAVILFLLEGRTPLEGDEANQQLLHFTFEAEDERYTWLNTTFIVGEGIIRESEPGSTKYVMHAELYRCVHELQPDG
ncbi:MAG: DUF3237 family protein [Ilumatobacteraceae bacterium]